jgi:hypothetical protein
LPVPPVCLRGLLNDLRGEALDLTLRRFIIASRSTTSCASTAEGVQAGRAQAPSENPKYREMWCAASLWLSDALWLAGRPAVSDQRGEQVARSSCTAVVPYWLPI